jgi:hypothetical protein
LPYLIRRLPFASVRGMLSVGAGLTATLSFAAQSTKPADPGKDAPPGILPNPVIVMSDADLEWVSVKNAEKSNPITAGEREPNGNAFGRQQVISATLTQADSFKTFREKNPKHPRAKEAKVSEALLLLQARSVGDTSQESRRKQRVDEIRRDSTIAKHDRLHVAALADHLEVAAIPNLTWPQRAAAYEKAIRKLMVEFPNEPECYEGLLRLATDGTDERAVSIANELVRAPVSVAVKSDAQLLLERFALIGRPLVDVAFSALGERTTFAAPKGTAVAVYTWVSSDPSSLAVAQLLAAKAPSGTKFVGINLDGGTPGVRGVAASTKLPGNQIYLEGPTAPLARALKVATAGLIYLADTTGAIRSVSAHHDIAAAFTALGTK